MTNLREPVNTGTTYELLLGGRAGHIVPIGDPPDEQIDVFMLLTVVITSYNYDEFIERAINSALNLDWPSVEVVVVDDGSTDDSIHVIESYGSRVSLIRQENGGQREAMNRGFAECHGDVVIFLDADDVLPQDLPAILMPAMRPGVSKSQFQMQRIDRSDRVIGGVFPRYRRIESPGTIRRWMLRTTAYPTPPGSGNAYARWFLDRVMPLPPQLGRAGDSGLLAAAPLFGDVIMLEGAVVLYRRHGGNDSALAGRTDRFVRECYRALDRWMWACAAAGMPVDPKRVLRSRELLQFRAAASRYTPRLRLPGDSTARLCYDAIAALARPGSESACRRIIVMVWVLAVALAPMSIAHKLIAIRFKSNH